MESLIPSQGHGWPNSSTPSHPISPPSGGEGGSAGIDLPGLLKRYCLLIAACMAGGIGLGILAYTRTAPTYQSTADVLIENQQTTTFSAEVAMGFSPNEKSIDTHVLVIRSPLIIKKALAKLDLQKYPGLRRSKKPVESVRRQLEVAKEGDWSSVMTMTYTSGDAKECEDVLAAIVEEYRIFLTESSKDLGEETIQLISQAKDELMTQLQQKQRTYDEFRKQAPLIYKDGKGVNPHRERQMEVEKRRSELLLQNSTLAAKLKNTIDALRSGGERRKAVYFEAIREIAPDEGKEVSGEVSQRQYLVALTDEYVRLRADEQRLATRFGDGHPDLLEIRRRIESLQDDLDIPDSDPDEEDFGDSPTKHVTEMDYISIYVNMLNDRLATGEEQVAELDRIYEDEQAKANSLQTFQIQDTEIRKDLEATQRLFDVVVSRLEEINIVQDHGGDSIDVLAPAELGVKIAPVVLTNVVLGCLLGAILGCGLSVVLDRYAAVFRSPMEIKRALGVPVVGRIPAFNGASAKVSPEFPSISPMLCTVHRDGSSLAESYRAVRTALFYSVTGNAHRIVQVTSPLPGDGKSTLTSNLAVTVAKSGKRVLLVDADFRKPTQHKLFGIQAKGPGLVSVVREEVNSADATISTGVPNLWIMPVTERASNPAELLTNPSFKRFLERMRSEYDFIIVDTPPVLAVTDPSAVAAQVDAVLMVLRIRRGVQVAARRARDMLSDVDAKLLGVVVNAVDPKSGYAEYGYGYGYGKYGGYGYGYTNEGDASTPIRTPERPEDAKRLVGGSVE